MKIINRKFSKNSKKCTVGNELHVHKVNKSFQKKLSAFEYI